MIEEAIKVFLLEDLSSDIELIKRQVLKYADKAVFTVASNREQFFERLEWLQPDLILSDYDLPDYNGLSALNVLKKKFPTVPFIFVTGTLNSETKAAQTILEGADGFVVKGKLETLPGVINDVMLKYANIIKENRRKAEELRTHKVTIEKLQARIQELEAQLAAN